MASPSSTPAVGGEASWSLLPPRGQSATSLLRAFLWEEGRVVWLERYGTLAARLLLSQLFILSGIMKVLDPAGTAAQMEERGMFWIPFFLWSAAAVELVGGLSLLLGYKTRLGALLLFLFLIPVTLTFHSWWTYADPREQQVNMLFFLHNLTLMGGLVLVMAFGPGPLSIDQCRRRAS